MTDTAKPETKTDSTPDKLKMHTPDLVSDNLSWVAERFPGCITESQNDKGELVRAVDFDLLRQELSTEIVEGPQERYHLNWPGKREALLAANAPIAKTLRPRREESVDFDTTRNLFIEGDNLDALKLLQETYLNKVKMIYIDPPYNTGREFIYDDDFAEDADEYLLRSGQASEQGARLVANTEANGRYHSDWLSMMYPRLRLARNLLQDDGVLFISIDDNESPNLRRLCDEVFGDYNFVGQLVWQRSKKGDSKLLAKVHEYIVCYARDKAAATASGPWRTAKEGVSEVLAEYDRLRGIHGSDHDSVRSAMQSYYKSLQKGDPQRSHKHYCWSDDRGLYFPDNFAGPDDGRRSRPRYDIVHPTTGKPCKKPSTGWRWDEKKTEWALSEVPSRIHFGPDETTIPNRKSYLKDNTGEPFSSVFYRDGRSATLEVERLIGEGWFQFPKNTEVLQKLIELCTDPGDIILDFFAGSGSTGHAAWKASVASGDRRFILVQLAEPVDKDGPYESIADICKHRLRQASAECKSAGGLAAQLIDFGFRSLRVDTTNMKEVYYRPDKVTPDLLGGHIDNIEAGRGDEDLLFQVLIDWGVDLSLPISTETIGGKTVYFVDTNALAACFETGITEDFVKELAGRKPLRVVFRDSGYSGDDVKINVEQIFKQLSPGTDVKTL